MENYDNEKSFVKKVVDFECNVIKAQDYIKENFGIDSEYNPETLELKLTQNSVNEALQLVSAKDYLENELPEDMIKIIF